MNTIGSIPPESGGILGEREVILGKCKILVVYELPIRQFMDCLRCGGYI